MKTLTKQIKQLVIRNRFDWVALIAQGYGVNYPGLWKTLGYHCPQEFKSDYQVSLLHLPSSDIKK